MELKTQRLLLRPLTMADAEAMYAYSKSEAVGPSAGWKPHASLAETREILRGVFIGKEGTFAMVDRDTGVLMGSIGLVTDVRRPGVRARMLGYAIGEEYWGRGYTTEAARAVLAYGFGREGAAIITATCYPENARSRRVLEKLGMRSEGHMRMADTRHDGSVCDLLLFSITAAEYEAL